MSRMIAFKAVAGEIVEQNVERSAKEIFPAPGEIGKQILFLMLIAKVRLNKKTTA
jgi:hypothetical protein